jgi:alkanesulfonate monooxygenase SsuD/methylene tetrahydromethanopterin reductase-like flavin-dependent oxidoreductase (luciferase family)
MTDMFSDQPVEFSIFDWLDETGRGYAKGYDERLELLAMAEDFGYYAYHLAEHHGSALSATPSPTVFLSALSQRTRKLRMGALTYVLPVYNPVRLLEELCMLDQLSHGRLELGIGRGASPHERQRFGVTPEESKPRFEEVLNLLIQGFTTGELNLHGEYYDYDNLKSRFRPYQKPYPPLWYPTSNEESVPYAASQGFNIVLSQRQWPFEKFCGLFDWYRSEYALHKDDPNRLNGHIARPFLGVSTHIYVADTDEKAMSEARPAYATFHHNFTHRYFDLGQNKYPRTVDFDEMVANGVAVCGSPETVRKVIARILQGTGANYIVGAFMWGDLTFDQMRRSIELFGKEVKPAFAGGLAAPAS